MSRRGFLWLAAALCVLGYIYAYASGRAGTPIRSDAFSYYVYLPSWFLHGDVSLQAVADECCGGAFPPSTMILRWPATGHWVNVHPIGEALLIAPFFATAHALTRWTNLSPDGFSLYYQHAAGLAGLCCVIAGLWCCGRLLARYFSEGVTTVTLAVLLTGTSLFHYATFDSAWSHAFSFALIAALFERLDAMGHQAGRRTIDDVLIGALCGLLMLVRHTHVLIPLALVGAESLRTRRLPLLATCVAGALVLPQLWLYRQATGHWIVSSYGGLGFTFATPHLAGVLVSPQKGLFFYAPLLLVALPGLAWLPAGLSRWRVPIVTVLVANVYLIASWWDWQFGASFGHRGFVDVYPLLAPGLAAAAARVNALPRWRVPALIGAALLCCLSLFQMLQYWHGVLPVSDTTLAQYRAVFLRGWW